MANFNVNMNGNARVAVGIMDNGVNIVGPDHPRGKAILTEGKSEEEFREQVKQEAAEQISKAKAKLQEFVDSAEQQAAEQEKKFEDDIEQNLDILFRS